MDDKALDAAIDSWNLHAPDGDGCVYMEMRVGNAIRMTNLGSFFDVLEKLATWCSENDPE